MTPAVLDVVDLSVGYGDHEPTLVVAGVSFQLRSGEILGLVGESGSGKSTSALTALGYRPPKATIASGQSYVNGTDLLSLSRADLHELWGKQIGYVAQNAGASLNPALTIFGQMALPLATHMSLHGREARQLCIDALAVVQLEDPGILDRYPHQFSGGQQQRIALGMALLCNPKVLILDEPTTGLDVTTQAQISRLVRRLVVERGIATLYVSHDLSLLAGLVDRVCVMYAGRVVETGTKDDVISAPFHPYTRSLIAAVPRIDDPRTVVGIPGEPPIGVVLNACGFAPRCPVAVARCSEGTIELREFGSGRQVRCVLDAPPSLGAPSPDPRPDEATPHQAESQPILVLRDLRCEYGKGKRAKPVVVDLSLELARGETVGIVGESGSGKTTVLRAIAGLHQGPLSGTVEFQGEVLAATAGDRPRSQRRSLQLVFQDPSSSLNPRHSVRTILSRAFRVLVADADRADEESRIRDLLAQVGLPRQFLDRYPWELSGGQQQRVAIARAFVGPPALLLCDEVTSALDVSVQATIIDLLKELTSIHGTSVLFVSHDLAVVRSIVSRIVVMRKGHVCETGPIDVVTANPSHPYTQELLWAVPRIS